LFFACGQGAEGPQLVDLLPEGFLSPERVGDQLLAGRKQLLLRCRLQLPGSFHFLNGILPLLHPLYLLLRRLVDDGKDDQDQKDQNDPDN